METIEFKDFKIKTKAYMKQVTQTVQPILVTSEDDIGDVVILSKKEWEGYQSTWEISQNKYLSDKIMAGLAEARNGQAKERL
ncbi:type II toxin-antitoxin system prevent-host-death family antitoxin [Streptococcus sobrinus]|uniref:type II toxin-antitoxin system prevent-host-death family antitoxin n=1 Tax=Streptococcus sobrinus TaxID=1310 RepID=UPI0003198DB6|nr:type II toxin-antitoxin system prevent-host-death family antitoxin [Streptococcus sobrinus]